MRRAELKILILSSSTGGGHDMRAQALEAWIERECASTGMPIHARRIQTLESTSPLYAFGVKLYNWIQRNAPRLHHIYFGYLELAEMHRYADAIIGGDRFAKKIHQANPDLVLSTHAHLNHGYFELCRRNASAGMVRPPPCVTYCGELAGGYGFSRHWVNPRSDLFIGAVHETCEQAADLGMPKERNNVGGFLLKPDFYQPKTPHEKAKEALAGRWNLDVKKPIVLLATGANSAGNHLECLKSLYEQKSNIQVLALCANHSKTLHHIQQWADTHPSMPVVAIPRTEEMAFFMDGVDMLFARPGTGTTSEAVMRTCPILFNTIGGIMPQEVPTIRYAHQHGFGMQAGTPNQMARQTEQMLKQETWIQHRRAMRSAQPHAHPRDILQHLIELSTNVSLNPCQSNGR